MNEKSIIFTILGSGTAIPYEKRVSSSYLVNFEGKFILLDAGFCVVYKLAEAGIELDKLDAIFLTHKHPDHFMGLIHILFALRNPYYNRRQPLKIYGFKGLKEYLEGFKKVLGRWIEINCKIEIIEENEGTFKGINYKLFPTLHTDESIAVYLDYKGKKILYTGDTEYSKKLSECCENIDLLVADCGSNEENKLKGHMNYLDVLKTAKNLKAKNVVFSHFYFDSNNFTVNGLKYDFSILKAYDLMKIYL